MKLLLPTLFIVGAAQLGTRGQVVVTPAAQTPEPKSLTTVIYEVRDLLARHELDFDAPKLGVEQARREVGDVPPRQLSEEETHAMAVQALEASILRYITPKLTKPDQRLQFTRMGSLIAALDSDQHAWLDRYINELRRFEGSIQIEARVFEIPRGSLATLGVESSAMLPTSTDRDAFVVKLGALPKANAINAPRLLTQPGQRAHVSVINQVSYIKSFTLQVVEPGQREIADPEIAVISEGLVLDVRATPIEKGVLGLELTLDCAEIVRPIATRKVRVSTSAPTESEIGVPEVLSSRIASTVLMREGSSVVISTPRQGDSKDLVLVVGVNVVPPPASPQSK